MIWVFTVTILLAVLGVAAFFAASVLYPLKYIDIIKENAVKNDISPEFVCAIIHAESRFNKNAVSRKGAGGLMQIMGSTAQWVADEMGIDEFTPEMVFEPEVNIMLGCYYIKMQLDRFDNDVTNALSAYNAGSTTVRNWLSDKRYSEDGKTLSYIPYKETRDYVERVDTNVKIYRVVLKIFNFFDN